MEYKIIKITCQNTGMSYITIDKGNGFLGSGTRIKNAIKEHGKENFTVDLLEDELFDISEVNNQITKYIAEHNTKWPNGYNTRAVSMIPEISPYGRYKISRANKGRKSPRKGVVVSEETRRKQSLARQGRKLKRNPVEILDAVTGEVMVFDGVQAAANYFGVTQGYISRCKKDKTKVIKGRFTAHP